MWAKKVGRSRQNRNAYWCWPRLVSLEMTFWLRNSDAISRMQLENLYIEQRLVEVLVLPNPILVVKYDAIF